MELVKKKRNSRNGNADGFLSGVLVLSLSTIIVKVIGLAYKIPMIAYLGAEGMGYFNSAYEIYAMLCVIATAGLPVALSMLISAHVEQGNSVAVRQTYRSALRLFLTLGSVGAAAMLFFARPISQGIGNEQATYCIMAIAPALFFVCLSSAIRGYFQGLNQMMPTAISQLIEALGKLIFGVSFAAVAIKKGFSLPLVAACAILGLSLGTLISALWLLWQKGREKALRSDRVYLSGTKQPNKGLKTLLRIAIPITLSSAVLSVTKLVDMALILRRMQAIGWSVSDANRIYGAYTTLAVPVFSLIPSLIAPISMALVPQLSAAIERHSKEEQAEITHRSIRLTVLLGMPASMGIAVYATPILRLLFSREDEAIAIAAPLLSILGSSILFSGMITTTNAILQSYRWTVHPMISMSIGALVKIFSAYALIGIPAVGVYGAPISTFLCNLTITIFNLRFLGRCIPTSNRSEGMLQIYYKPMLASFISVAGSLAIYFFVQNLVRAFAVALLAAMLFAVGIYGILIVILHIVTEEDIRLLPFGKKAVELWYKYKRKDNNKEKGIES